MIKFIGIIPARYESSRFPGKPLVDILGKPMIQRVYEQAIKSIETIYVATDDERIATVVKGFNGNFVLTSKNHLNGTERCAEAIDIIEQKTNIVYDVVVNIQGDEPFINPYQIDLIKSIFTVPNAQIGTLVKPLFIKFDIENPNVVKAIFDTSSKAIYFSRFPIPFNRDKGLDFKYHKHIGIYAYRKKVLYEITKLPQSELEKSESLEQLRWIENGYSIYVKITDFESIAIDTPDDLNKISL